jgi:hypothetical protein
MYFGQDPDPVKNRPDPQHWFWVLFFSSNNSNNKLGDQPDGAAE